MVSGGAGLGRANTTTMQTGSNAMPQTITGTINGIDTDALLDAVQQIKADPSKGQTTWGVATSWLGGFASETNVTGWTMGGEHKPQRFSFRIDEPRELCGQDAYANPQEYLLGAMNACMLNTFVAVCSLQGVKLESLRLECEGDIDLRGFLGIDASVPAGYTQINYRIYVKGDGTPQQYAKAHEAMQATSPNYFNLSRPVKLIGEVVAGS